MSSLHEKLTEIGFTPSEVKYLKARGAKRTKAQAIHSNAGLGGLNLNGPKGARFFQRFIKKTGWDNETVHCRVGEWVNTGTRPVDAPIHPKCPECGGTDVDAFSIYPFEQRCDQCFAAAIAAWEVAENDARGKRTALGHKLASAMNNASEEAEKTGEVSIPSLDAVWSTALELGGGWVKVAESITEMIQSPSPKIRADATLKALAYLEKREAESDGVTINVEGLTAEEVDRVIVDAVLSQWHRRKDQRAALTEVLRQRGASPPQGEEELTE